ncbi:CoA-binding protein [Candidatus Woesearchaeota archaeon]|nr:CoA-binding protein [Candidatus Woesearchaeota archaeon]
MNLDKFFKAKSIAIVGVSQNPSKVGHVIFRNLIDSGYKGDIFIINPNTKEILGYKSYKKIYDIKNEIDLAVIAVPVDLVFQVLEDCNKKRVKNIIIVTSGFKEIGNYQLENKIRNFLIQNKIDMIGVNCLGVLDTYTNVDTLFLPRFRLKRPPKGGISFISQSGAVGSTILDLAAKNDYGFSKFISYGNATQIDESDLMDYLINDKQTKVICMYIEGVVDGKKFIETAKKATRKKPVLVLKGGITEESNTATISHTGSLAGDAAIYKGVFKQTGIIQVSTMEEIFDYSKLLENSIKPKGRRIQVITNGGGFGIITTDSIIKNDLVLAELSDSSKKILKKNFPPIAQIHNPLDLLGDANTERYKLAIETCMNDSNIDIILVIALLQTPLVTVDIVDVITELNDIKKKPIIVVCTGGNFTQVLKDSLEENGVPTFTFPENAVKSIKSLVDYARK